MHWVVQTIHLVDNKQGVTELVLGYICLVPFQFSKAILKTCPVSLSHLAKERSALKKRPTCRHQQNRPTGLSTPDVGVRAVSQLEGRDVSAVRISPPSACVRTLRNNSFVWSIFQRSLITISKFTNLP